MGVEVIGNIQAVFDTGTFAMIGDLVSVQNLFAQIFGAVLAPAYNTDSLRAYTSALIT
jgi:hypothetical protein